MHALLDTREIDLPENVAVNTRPKLIEYIKIKAESDINKFNYAAL